MEKTALVTGSTSNVGKASRTMDGRTYENKRIPLGHIGDPQDPAEMVAFLVSEKANFITGTIIRVDGGIDIKP